MLEVFEYLANAGQRAPSADNSQPWIFARHDRSLKLFIDLGKIKPSCFDVEHPAILLAIGAVIENVLEAANWIGIEITYDNYVDLKTGLCATFHVAQHHLALPDNANEHPLFKRHTNRLPFEKRPISKDILTKIKNISNSKDQILIIEDAESFKQWAEWIKTASEVRFQTPDIHEWFGQSLKFTNNEVSSNEGLDVATLGLPLIGKIFLKATQTWERMNILNKIGMHKLIAKLESAKIKDSAALIGITGTLDIDTIISSGRLMERIWITLNAGGLSVQPYFVISDQLYRFKRQKIPHNLTGKIANLEANLQPLLKDSFLYILLRVGYCKQQPKMSLRKKISFN
ncbi:hypothetical protein [Methylomonas albis]|uniref:Nitroreductase n=1 Tax=Methylomonas albis TaxID=1854563 RepID=A0ABR9D3P3_9GAMM|nr:hypothetical protein [Methylomonas albis]MBD9357740.1 hypothetical protein [Methylomonas albis]